MAKYRKKPIVIDAFQWTGGPDQKEDPLWIIDAIKNKKVWFKNIGSPSVKMKIETLEGVMTADVNDWIIKNTEGEIHPCKPNIFDKAYELAEELTEDN